VMSQPTFLPAWPGALCPFFLACGSSLFQVERIGIPLRRK
jgi:hypothetical protein